jgi:hypothetical protein
MPDNYDSVKLEPMRESDPALGGSYSSRASSRCKGCAWTSVNYVPDRSALFEGVERILGDNCALSRGEFDQIGDLWRK